MKPRQVPLLVGAVFLGSFGSLAAQEPVQAPDTGQGYAPAAAPAPAAVPYVPPGNAAAPAPAPTANTTVTQAAGGRTLAQSLGFIDVIPVRSPDRIRTEIEAARAASREADARTTESSSQQAQTKAMVDVKKQELSTLGARIKLAEKQKAETDKITLEAEKKVAERQKQFLERRQALHGAELDRAKAGKKLASAQQKALELELQLSQRHADRAAVSDPAVALRSDQVIRELERKTLEAQRQQADAAKDVAARDEDIAKRRLDLYQAQMAAGASN